MNEGAVIAALVTAVGAVIISIMSTLQSRRAQDQKTQTDRLAAAQAQTDRLIINLQEQNSMLWERVNALQGENDVLRKRLRVVEGDL